jgi:hypothetical protein
MDVFIFNFRNKVDMNRDLMKLVMAFAGVWIVLAIYSFTSDKFQIKGKIVELKKSPLKKIFVGNVVKKPRGKAVKKIEDSYFVYSEKKFKSGIDSTKQRFLYFGDSMQEGLIRRWNDYCKKNGHEIYSVIWYSSTTKEWGSCDTLAYFIKKIKPTFVICVLGGNELFIRDVKENREDFVKHIIRQAGETKFIWIGPPNWKPDTGINDLIKENVGDKRFFLTNGMKFDRKKDGAHPTYESAYKWADSVATWIVKKSEFPVILNKPDTMKCRIPSLTILKPAN